MLSHQLLTFGKMQAFRAGRREAFFRIIHLKATITMFKDDPPDKKNKNHKAHIKLSLKVTAQKRSLQLLFSFESSLSVSSSPHTEQQVFLQDPELNNYQVYAH